MIKDIDYRHKCDICGKVFSTYSAGAGWLYKSQHGTKLRWYCSYTCWRKYRAPIEQREKERAMNYEQIE